MAPRYFIGAGIFHCAKGMAVSTCWGLRLLPQNLLSLRGKHPFSPCVTSLTMCSSTAGLQSAWQATGSIRHH